ncbi:MAG: hypothetical protein AAFX87_29945 [Bacteroidota bacterium]
MKRTTILLLICLISGYAWSQDEVKAKLVEARTSYQSKDLEATRFALQQSLSELDVLVGKEILKKLPTSVNGMDYIPEEDNVVGSSMGFTGVFVYRFYKNDQSQVEVDLVNDSPLMASLSTFLTNPLFNVADGSRKVIKIDGYKAAITRNEGEGPASYDVQIPIDQSLYTIKVEGVENENDVIDIAKSMKVGDIANMLK